MKRKLFIFIPIEVILGFFALLAFGQCYSWFYTPALIALVIYALIAIAAIVLMICLGKKGKHKAVTWLHIGFILYLAAPTVLAVAVLVWAFMGMAIYG